MIMASLGRFGISAAFAIMYLYSVELFPTVLRTGGFGSASMISRVGSILAPIISRELGKVDESIPLIIFTVFAVGNVNICNALAKKKFAAVSFFPASGFMSLLLPETAGKPLPNTIQEGKNLLNNFI